MPSVSIHGKQYAVGLWWQLHRAKQSRKYALHMARATAKEFAEKGYSSVAITAQQYGLGTGDYKKNSLALASSIRPSVQLSQGFIGIFKFHEGWWVCGLTSSSIAAEGDQFFATQEEAEAHALQLADLFGEKSEVFCSTQEESEGYLAPLLSNGARVEPLTFGLASYSYLGRYMGIACVMLLVALLGKVAWDALASEAAKEKAQEIMQSSAARQERVISNVDLYFPKPWQSAPSVGAMQVQCMNTLLSIPFYSEGWERTSAVCTPANLSIEWIHSSGASFTKLPLSARLTKPKQAISSIALPSLDAKRDHFPLRTRKDISIHFYEITRQLHCQLTYLSWAQRAVKTVEGVNISAPFIQGSWELTNIPSSYMTDVLFAFLGQMAGLTLKEISYDDTKGTTWTIKGEVYALAQ